MRVTGPSLASLAALLPLLLATACSGELGDASAAESAGSDTGATGRVAQRIINGTADTAAGNAVVYIALGAGAFCTGTLIAPNVVLTAHHCVATPDETVACGAFSAPSAPSTITVSVGLTPAGATAATATTIITDTAKPNNICGNDIGLFQLDHDIPGAIVAKVRFTALAAGEAVTTVGYGADGTGNPTASRFVKTGLKIDGIGPKTYDYTTAAGAAMPVTLSAGEIGTGESTCFGDSGGPLFDAAGNVVGMTSRGIDAECNDRPSIYTDTASHAQVIQAAVTAAGHTLQPAATVSGQATPQSSTPDGTGATEGDPSTGDGTTAPKTTTKRAALDSTPNQGCSTTPGAPPRTSSLALVGIALGIVLARRRRAAA